MFNGTANRALAKADEALEEARKSTALTETHMKECTLRAEQVKDSLSNQDKDLCDIKDALKWVNRGVLGGLVSAIAYILVNVATHVQFHP